MGMDERLQERGVFFLPWVGKRYCSDAASLRLLILGESHYGDEGNETPDLSRRCVQEHSDRTWDHRFFTMLTQIVSGHDHWDVDRQEFWGEICFYNYVQRTVAETPGVAPKIDDFVRNEEALRAVIEHLTPTHVLVCSWRLWNNLPKALFSDEPSKLLSGDWEVRKFNIAPSAVCMGIPHPSRAAREPVTRAVAGFLHCSPLNWTQVVPLHE